MNLSAFFYFGFWIEVGKCIESLSKMGYIFQLQILFCYNFSRKNKKQKKQTKPTLILKEQLRRICLILVLYSLHICYYCWLNLFSLCKRDIIVSLHSDEPTLVIEWSQLAYSRTVNFRAVKHSSLWRMEAASGFSYFSIFL